MKEATISLQDLRRRIYRKAKAVPEWRFWGMYVHVCKLETLQEAYRMAKRNDGAPGIDGMTFAAIEATGLQRFLECIQRDLILRCYRPSPLRKKRIPKGGGKFRTLGIPTIRDRVVQGALKLILEPIFEADFQEGSYGYRPKRAPHAAVHRVTSAVVKGMTRVIDVDLASYFDTIRHHILLRQVALRVKDRDILWLLKRILKSGGKRGVPQGGVISPLLSNIYLNGVDRMLERAKAVTREKGYFHMEYARFADDLVIVVDGYRKWRWLERGVYKRLLEELAKLDVSLNVEKTRESGPHPTGELHIPGFPHSSIQDEAGSLGRIERTSYEGAYKALAAAQGGIPTSSLAAGGTGDCSHQPNTAGMGELFPHGAIEPLLRLRT